MTTIYIFKYPDKILCNNRFIVNIGQPYARIGKNHRLACIDSLTTEIGTVMYPYDWSMYNQEFVWHRLFMLPGNQD